MGLGFSAMAMMSVQFFLTARFPRASAPFGIDIIYYFHRYLAIIIFAFVFLHFLIIRFDNVEALGAINPLDASWHMSAGRGSLLLLLLLLITSLWRKPLGIHYDQWRMLHIGLAITAFLLALGHIIGTGHYVAAPGKLWLWTGYTLFWLLLIVKIRLFKPWQMHKRPYRVIEVRPERGRRWTLALAPDGHAGISFHPGQFAWLTLWNCARCRSIAGRGNPRSPLDGVGTRHNAEALQDWTIGADALREALPEGIFRLKQTHQELLADDLDALVIYLQSLRVGPPTKEN